MSGVMLSGYPSKGLDARAPRSKGCLTCRRRKVKCDERRPTCARCDRGQYTCLGYDKPLIFVHHGPNRPRIVSTTEFRPTGDSRRKKVARCKNGVSENRTLIKAHPDSTSSPAHNTQSDIGFVGRDLDLSGFADEIVIAHLLSKFGIHFDKYISQGTDAPTMATVLTSRNNESSAYQSGLGLAQAFFGSIHKDDAIVRQSAMLYGKALTSLRADLQLADQKLACSRAYMNLWTCVFLGLYEMVLSAEPSNWLQHVMGVSALTQVVGPEAFQSHSANTMLETYRSMIASAHISQRKRCFLGSPEWQIIPWVGSESPPKTLSSKILDVLCDIPGLMEDVDAMAHSERLGQVATMNRGLLQDKVLNSIEELSDIRWQWEAAYPGACTEFPSTPGSSVSSDTTGQPLFATYLRFEDLDRAIDVLYLNSVRLMLYTLSDSVALNDVWPCSGFGQYKRNGPGSNPLVLPGQGDRVAHALEICRIAEHLMQGGRESQGLLILLFPLRVAYTHLQELPKVVAWIQHVMGRASSKGFKLGENVLKLQSETIKKAKPLR